jgi:hypothetical protein
MTRPSLQIGRLPLTMLLLALLLCVFDHSRCRG